MNQTLIHRHSMHPPRLPRSASQSHRERPEPWEQPPRIERVKKIEMVAISSDRILIGICSCRHYREKRQAVRETWLSRPMRDIEALFFVGSGTQQCLDEPDTVFLEAPDSYEELPAKVVAFFVYALENHEFDWLFKCDDDTYVALDRLHDLTVGDHAIVGNPFLKRSGYPSGGAGYMLSREIVECIARGEPLATSGAEDIIIGTAALRYGAVPFSTDRLCYDRSRIPRRENDLISCHWCSPDELRSTDAVYRGEVWRLNDIRSTHSSYAQYQFFQNGYFGHDLTSICGKWTIEDSLVVTCNDGKVDRINLNHLKSDGTEPFLVRQPRTLIFSSIGDEATAPLSWLAGKHDVALICYGEDRDSPLARTLERRSRYFGQSNGGKFQNLLKWLDNNPEIFEMYDKFLVIDDDLIIGRESMTELLYQADVWDFEVCTPSQSSAGKISWKHLVQNLTIAVSLTNFVEMCCVLFSRSALAQFIERFRPVAKRLVGWGTDYIISSACFSEDRPFGIINTVSVINPRRVNDTGIERLQGWSERLRNWKEVDSAFPLEHLGPIGAWRPQKPDIPVVCINLRRAQSRRDKTLSFWKSIMADELRFVEAIDRRDIDSGRIVPQQPEIPPSGSHRSLTNGEIACLMSHISAHENYRSMTDGILVMEDDVLPSTGAGKWRSILKQAIAQAPFVDIVMMSKPVNPFSIAGETEQLWICGTSPPYGTHMVWYSPTGSLDFVARRKCLNFQSDYWIDFCKEHRLAVLKVPLAIHEGKETYIGNKFRGAASHRKYIE